MPPPPESQIVLLVEQKAAGKFVEPRAERKSLAVGAAVAVSEVVQH